MKTIRSTILLFLVVGGVGFLGYRAYRWNTDRERTARLAAAEQAAALERENEARRQARIEAEAHRLSAPKAQQDAVRAEAELARLRAEQADAELARAAAERAAKEAADTQARTLCLLLGGAGSGRACAAQATEHTHALQP